MQAKIGGREIVVGKFAFVHEHAPDAERTTIAPGELAVYVAIDGRYAGALLASDRLRRTPVRHSSGSTPSACTRR